jgi:hypothetical protein
MITRRRELRFAVDALEQSIIAAASEGASGTCISEATTENDSNPTRNVFVPGCAAGVGVAGDAHRQ